MKAFLHYIVLVGIPVLSVIVFLQIGENSLTAPASVGGKWQLEPILAEGNQVCTDFLFNDEEPRLSISQSGVYLALSFNDEQQTTLSGMLTERTLTAETSEVSLMATIDRDAEPDRLEGTLTIASCETTLSLSATRQPELAQTSGGH